MTANLWIVSSILLFSSLGSPLGALRADESPPVETHNGPIHPPRTPIAIDIYLPTNRILTDPGATLHWAAVPDTQHYHVQLEGPQVRCEATTRKPQWTLPLTCQGMAMGNMYQLTVIATNVNEQLIGHGQGSFIYTHP